MWMTFAILGVIIFLGGITSLVFTIVKKWSPIATTLILCIGGFLMLFGFIMDWGTSPVMDVEAEIKKEEQRKNEIINASVEVSRQVLLNATKEVDGYIFVEGIVDAMTGDVVKRFIIDTDDGSYVITNFDYGSEVEVGDSVKVYGKHKIEEHGLPAIHADVVEIK